MTTQLQTRKKVVRELKSLRTDDSLKKSAEHHRCCRCCRCRW